MRVAHPATYSYMPPLEQVSFLPKTLIQRGYQVSHELWTERVNSILVFLSGLLRHITAALPTQLILPILHVFWRILTNRTRSKSLKFKLP